MIYNNGRKVNASEKKGEFLKGFLEFSTKKDEVIYFENGYFTGKFKQWIR